MKLKLIIAGLITVCSVIFVGCESRNNKEMNFSDLISGNNDIILSAHKAPYKDNVNDQQYKYLVDAHIDMLEWEYSGAFHNDPDTIKQTLDMCNKYGLKITICDSDFKNLSSASDERIRTLVNRYKSYDCVRGYHIADEPSNANQYARVVKIIKEEDPNCIPQLNFLPLGALGDKSKMEDYISCVGSENICYLSYDEYPFGNAEGSIPQMFTNMNVVREIALKYGVNTALYIQSVGYINAYRKPTVSETRYHMSSALAYGYKNLKFYTWCTTPYNPDKYTDAIIGHDLLKSDTYDGICAINSGIKKVSRVLGNLDAIEIYHSGRVDSGTVMLGNDWYVRKTDNSDFIVSLMKDRNTGRNYLMFVNKDFKSDKTLKVEITGVKSISDITEGTISNAEFTGSSLSMNLKAGGFRLFVLGKDDNLEKNVDYADSADNYAINKPVYASSSKGDGGMYACKANDGIQTSVSESKGWVLDRKGKDEESWIMFDLLREVDINSVSFYPFGTLEEHFKLFFPKSFRIECGNDGITWETVLDVKDSGFTKNEKLSYYFDTIKTRFIRIYIYALEDNDNPKAAFAEIEIKYEEEKQ